MLSKGLARCTIIFTHSDRNSFVNYETWQSQHNKYLDLNKDVSARVNGYPQFESSGSDKYCTMITLRALVPISNGVPRIDA